MVLSDLDDFGACWALESFTWTRAAVAARGGGRVGRQGARGHLFIFSGVGWGTCFAGQSIRGGRGRKVGLAGVRASHRHFVNEEVITQPVRRTSATI